MSINWKEIHEVLREGALYGARIGDIAQPDFEQLLIMINTAEHSRTDRNNGHILRISHQAHRCVMHLSAMDMPKVSAPVPRFMQLARARLRGGVIIGCAQCSDQRIVRIAIRNNGSHFGLWVRLWSGAANSFLTDENDTIIDAYYRRPRAREVSGTPLITLIADQLATHTQNLSAPYDCALRAHQYDSYNEMLDMRYRVEDDHKIKKALTQQVISAAQRRLRHLRKQVSDDEEHGAAHDGAGRNEKRGAARNRARRHTADRYRAMAMLLQQQGHAISVGTTQATLTDPATGVTHDIAIDPRLSIQQNAQAYFSKYKERRRAEERRIETDAHTQESIARLERVIAEVPHAPPPTLRQELARLGGDTRHTSGAAGRGVAGGSGARQPGMLFYAHGFIIMVGKSAMDSDRLMRSMVKGNDMWMHARGVTGSSVFIQHRKGKSVPLETLYDAATLAHHFSKARGNAHIDAFYTEVKHVRRAKNAPQGTFIPFRDHGLTLSFDRQRLVRLQQSRSYDIMHAHRQ